MLLMGADFMLLGTVLNYHLRLQILNYRLRVHCLKTVYLFLFMSLFFRPRNPGQENPREFAPVKGKGAGDGKKC